ncbi:ferredoxin:protochlorophyllide reductase (ATP-dependent) subunit B [Candidatus Cyanaurora vandensis]|uniref:ferredoxin:protochlorophyllide reductase (ATP-dependent) subunit B n=1 Tax=Candidatus Cyanaurora vandensis TaxID=2714958 RepID=UPI002580BC36|nr:ferredoxin:protochlorophyllide reductase (ATP-dependent) subunit B [Candidatus Cyanaurora vandensis]
MKLAYWMYAGPAHIGTLRIASSFKNVQAIMHAPLGDDYFNVMRSMLERERNFTPVTTSVVDRKVLGRGSQDKVVDNIVRKDKEDSPDLIILTPTCTSSILQEDLQNFVARAQLSSDAAVMLADVNHYRVNELQAADRTLAQVIAFYLEKQVSLPGRTSTPSVNILGSTTLGFHNDHDIKELQKLFTDLGITVNVVAPKGCSVPDLVNLPRAWFNVAPYREIGPLAAQYLQEKYDQPYVDITPMGVVETARFIRRIQQILAEQGHIVDYEPYIRHQTYEVSQLAWFSRSIDCQNLQGKRVVVFGDTTHAAAMTKILAREMNVTVVFAGTFCKYDEQWLQQEIGQYCEEVIATDDHTRIGDMIARAEPAAIFGTQMERHIGKRLDIPCGVISAPIHIQNFPVGYRPFLGYEGTNHIADLVYNSFTLGMEDHMLEVFSGHDTKEVVTKTLTAAGELDWDAAANKELGKVPGFVRSKVKRNTEKYARDQNLSRITLEVMYAAKEAAGA